MEGRRVTRRRDARLRRWGIAAWSVIGIGLVTVSALWALAQVRDVLQILLLALVIVFLLNPAVSALQRRGVPRAAGSCLTYVVLAGIVAVGLVIFVPVFVQQVRQFVQDFPATAARLSDFAGRVDSTLAERFPSFDLSQWIADQVRSLARNVGKLAFVLLGAVQAFAVLVVGPVIAFYLLIDLPRLQRMLLRIIAPSRRSEVAEVAAQVARTMGSFFRGQLAVAVIVGILSSLAMRLIGLPYWLLVGMVAGSFNIIPLIGPYIGAIPGIVIAGTFLSPIHMLFVALAMLAVQQIDNHFISPNVMRLAVHVRPVTVMVSLIAGASIAGFWGMLLAVPFVASARVVLAHLWRTRVPWGQDVFTPDDPVPHEETPPKTERSPEG